MEKVYGLVIYCKRHFDLKVEDFSPFLYSFIRLPYGSAKTEELTGRTVDKYLLQEIDLLLKPLSKDIAKIKSRKPSNLREAVR